MPPGPDQQPLLPCPHKSPAGGLLQLQAAVTPQLLISGLKTLNLKSEQTLITARSVCLMPAQQMGLASFLVYTWAATARANP